MRIKLDIFNIGIFISSFISFIITLLYFDNYKNGYNGMISFPIIYIFVYFVIFMNLRRRRFPFTIYGIIIVQWIRFVLMPPVLAVAGEDVGFTYINPKVDSLELSILLMIVEIFTISLFCMFWFHAERNNNIKTFNIDKLYFSGNLYVYILFILFAVGIILTYGRTHNLINFIYIPLEADRLGDVRDTLLVLARQVIIIGLFIVFLLVINMCKIKYINVNIRMYNFDHIKMYNFTQT